MANRVAAARMATRSRLSGKQAGTRIVAQVPGWDLEGIESGKLRHPVYARGDDRKTWAWAEQNVPAEVAGKAFLACYPEMERAVENALDIVIASVEARI